ncbi:CapA family protein [Halomicrococcus sp. NG-SE-24]|uniref:CapA family protein n=1 Tax=Halomicrococcus sp. NG-SE-24 TaxID=3436928 RepID=UPI003D981435
MADDLSFDAGGAGSEWSLFVAGDCVPDRDDTPLVAPTVVDRIADADLAAANLEAPVETDADPVSKSGPALTADPDAPERLADAGFDVLALANNHVMDYGATGMRATREACATAGVRTAGAGEDRTDALEPARFEVRGVDVAVVSVCEREFGVATADRPGTAWSGHRDAVAAVRGAADDADAVVVLSHGGAEYVPLPPPSRRARLREFVEAGADLVVGHHPHVAQGWELYEDAPVFYSLGNFVFDRQADEENTARGLALDVRFANGAVAAVDLVPTVLDGSVRLLDGDAADEYRDYLHRAADVVADEERYEAHWQAIAVRLFYERYSNWLMTGVGENLALARTNPHDPDAQRPLWDPERRRRELLTLLNLFRNESHGAVVTTALEVLSGNRSDRRTESVEESVDALLAWTGR